MATVTATTTSTEDSPLKLTLAYNKEIHEEVRYMSLLACRPQYLTYVNSIHTPLTSPSTMKRHTSLHSSHSSSTTAG